MTSDTGAPYEPTLLDLPVLPYGDRETGRSSGWSGSETSAERAHTEDANGTTSERQQTVLLWLNLRRSAGATWKELAEAKGWHHGQASGVLSGLHKEGKIARLAEERRHRCAVYVLPEWVADRPTAEQGRERPRIPTEDELALAISDPGSVLPRRRNLGPEHNELESVARWGARAVQHLLDRGAS